LFQHPKILTKVTVNVNKKSGFWIKILKQTAFCQLGFRLTKPDNGSFRLSKISKKNQRAMKTFLSLYTNRLAAVNRKYPLTEVRQKILKQFEVT